MADPVILTPDQARSVRAEKRAPSIASVLRSGQMVFLPGKGPHSASGWRTQLRPEGLKVHTKTGTKDGQAGIFVWADRG